MVRTAHLAARIAILPALFLPTLAAQQAPALLATARYLFVVQGVVRHAI